MIPREFIALTGGAALAWSLEGRAQQKAMPVIGFLSSRTPSDAATVVAAFHQGLAETRYVEGQNLAIEYRWAEGRYDRLPALAADLVGRKVDLIVASGGPPSVRAAKSATSTIPPSSPPSPTRSRSSNSSRIHNEWPFSFRQKRPNQFGGNGRCGARADEKPDRPPCIR
jgi:hypothetical protein